MDQLKSPPPHEWNLKQVEVSVDLNDGASTVLSGTMRYIGRNEIKYPIFGEFNDEGTPVVPHHLQARLQEPRQTWSVEYGNSSFGVVYIALSFAPLLDMRDVRRGEYHTVTRDAAHTPEGVFMVFLHHDDVIWEGR